MVPWLPYAIAAALLYGLHQVFTKLAAPRIGGAAGGFIVEATAAAAIAAYMVYLRLATRDPQAFSWAGATYSALTGVCVGAGTLAFFLLFQKGAPLSAVPLILAGGAALMALAGILFFHESASWQRLTGIGLSVVALLLVFYTEPAK